MWPGFYWVAPIVAVVGGLIGFVLPRKLVERLAARRLARFEGQLLDALGSIRNGLRSGRGILQCIESLVREMGDPCAQEFGIFLRQHRVGKDIGECAELMRKRLPSDDLALVMTSISINQRVGGNLSDILARLEQTVRSRIEFKDKVEAATSQGKFEGMVMGAAPFVIAGILLLIDRSLMLPLFTDPVGWAAWGAIVVLEVLAFLMIRSITTIEP